MSEIRRMAKDMGMLEELDKMMGSPKEEAIKVKSRPRHLKLKRRQQRSSKRKNRSNQ